MFKESLSVFTKALKIEDVRKKLLYVLLILFIYRIGANVPLPGIDFETWQWFRTWGGHQTLIGAITGGGIGTIFAMGIGPFITASIIMQLLTVAIPKLEELKKEGEEGKKKINQYTRILAVFMAFFQGIGMVFMLSMDQIFMYPGFLTYTIALMSLVTGTMFVMWLGELLTERGVGNGTSFMIFANILAGVPMGIFGLFNRGVMGEWAAIIIAGLVGVLIVFLGLMIFAILLQGGERRLPVQNSKKMVGATGRTSGSQNSYIPLKVNMAGVMALIFSLSILGFPEMISMVWSTPLLDSIVRILSITDPHPIGAIIYAALIIGFTFFYTSFSINPIEMAENMKKNGGFIPGIRPGKPTSDYIQRTVYRLSWIGAGFYVTLAMIPIVFQWFTGIPIGFGGTTLLIVTGVALELVKQIESQLLMRHYKGFLS